MIFFDGATFASLSNLLIYGSFKFIPMLFLAWIAFVTMFNDDNDIRYYFWLMIAGLFFGINYVEPSGIYIYIIGFLIFGLMTKFFSRPNSGVPYNLFIFSISLLTYLYVTYGLGKLSNLATDSIFEYTLYSVMPVIILNTILFIILYFPIQRLIIWADEGRADSPYRGRNR